MITINFTFVNSTLFINKFIQHININRLLQASYEKVLR